MLYVIVNVSKKKSAQIVKNVREKCEKKCKFVPGKFCEIPQIFEESQK